VDTIHFSARDLNPWAEHVAADDLRQGDTYFAVHFVDDEMLVPELRPLVFIGADRDPASDYDSIPVVYTPRMNAETLRRLRARLHLSQAKLARLIGIAPNSVARMERGERPISEPVARLLLFVARDVEAKGRYAEYLASIRGQA
jgi:DNA-binding transcriptional regulator YiaG